MSKIITVNLPNGEGTTIRINRVSYLRKSQEGFDYFITVYYFSGRVQELNYGVYYAERDEDFNVLSRYLK